MERCLNSLFADSGGEPIFFDGRTVHIVYKRPIQPGDHIQVDFLSSRPDRVQGINLRTKGGLLEAGGVRSSAISLWLDTAPPSSDVQCIKPPRDGLLMVSNQWRRPDGVEDEWTNNAGMVIEDHNTPVVLRCSDGVGSPNFDDLVVALRFGSTATSGRVCRPMPKR